MAVTRTETVDEILNELVGAHAGLRARIDSITTTDTTLTFLSGGNQVRPGDFVELDEEVVFIESGDFFDIFEVIRAERNSTATAHAVDTRARVNSRWWRIDIVKRLYDEILALPSDLYAVREVDIDFGASQVTVPIPSVPTGVTVLGVRQAMREPLAGETREPNVSLELVRDGTTPRVQFKDQGLAYNSPVTVRVAYAHTFNLTAWTDSTALDDDIGLPESLIAAVRYGTMARLQSTRELAQARVAAIGQSSEREDVPIGSNIEIARELQRLRDVRIEEERARLVALWPRLFRRV